ncbi:putative rhomboid protease [Saxophila tyrrhenica]|uniref:rhomboid protease n=1 Tax=Saxophila tyrrhenica TaxID=1690608 RepID=A0AAV9PJ44_9PEZI|nr:putative rhomboid protease [Saxophila tyrrhenica]
MAYNIPDVRRIRSYFLRLPLATRLLLLVLTGFYIAVAIRPELEQWGALIPQEINLTTLYRLNTYPLLHKSLPHYLLNTLTLLPLLERFESDHGTIVTLLLFTGSFGYLPGGLYTLLERYVFHSNTSALGASVWVFLLLASESIKTYRANPNFQILDVRIPTWTTPLIFILIVSFLVPHTSFLGHICGAATGYLWGLGYIRFLAPSEKILRWIEGKLNLLGRIPHYVSVDQKTYGRYGVLPSTSAGGAGVARVGSMQEGILAGGGGAPLRPMTPAGGQRLGG